MAPGEGVRHPGSKTRGFTDKLGRPSIHETYPTPLPPFVIGRFISQPGLRGRRRAAGQRCRAVGLARSESVGLAWDPPGNDPARASLGAGPPPSAAAGAGESPLFESVAPSWSDAAAAGLHWPAADGTAGCGPARSSVSPIPNGCPSTAGRLSAAPEKGARRFENVTVVR